jgi:hypothetical protein
MHGPLSRVNPAFPRINRFRGRAVAIARFRSRAGNQTLASTDLIVASGLLN